MKKMKTKANTCTFSKHATMIALVNALALQYKRVSNEFRTSSEYIHDVRMSLSFTVHVYRRFISCQFWTNTLSYYVITVFCWLQVWFVYTKIYWILSVKSSGCLQVISQFSWPPSLHMAGPAQKWRQRRRQKKELWRLHLTMFCSMLWMRTLHSTSSGVYCQLWVVQSHRYSIRKWV